LKKAFLAIFIVLVLDQASKFWIKTHMYLGEEFNVLGDWFIIHFTENNGMAFGLEFAGQYGKLFLTLFRIVAVGGLFWYIYDLHKKYAHPGYIISIALITAGALGNIIDSMFYGIWFNDSLNNLATFMPEEGGYAPLFYGRVVDMLYFPIIEGYFPEWFPIWGGEHFLFFRPVFNIADSSITVGVALIILFNKRFFVTEQKTITEEKEA
jgi:signal peptidase II